MSNWAGWLLNDPGAHITNSQAHVNVASTASVSPWPICQYRRLRRRQLRQHLRHDMDRRADELRGVLHLMGTVWLARLASAAALSA